MKKTGFKTRSRMISLILTLVLVVGTMPMQSYGASITSEITDEGGYVLTVVDKDGDGIYGAKIEYAIDSGNLSPTTTSPTGTLTTDSSGIVALSDMSYYSSIIKGDTEDVTIDLTVTATGYQDVVIEDRSVTSINESITIQMTSEDDVIVTTNQTGTGTVSVNDDSSGSVDVTENSAPTIVVAPIADTSYIKSVTIGGVTQTISDADTVLTIDNVQISENTTIEVVFGSYCTVYLPIDLTNGTIVATGYEGDSFTVKDGTEVAFVITPGTGYQIESVLLGGAKEESVIGSDEAVTIKVTIDEITGVEVTFEEIQYTVSVSVTEGGGVTYDYGDAIKQEFVNGAVEVVYGDGITITATPDTGYRVSSVKINDEDPETFEDNNEAYTDTIEKIYKAYTYDITFALNEYEVTCGETEYGTVTIGDGEATTYTHGSDVKLEFAPIDGYTLESVLINEVDVTENTAMSEEDGNDNFYYTISSISEDTEISIVYKAEESIAWTSSDVTISDDGLLRQDGNLYVYQSNTTVTLTASAANGIDVNENGKKNNNTWSTTEDTHIETLRTYLATGWYEFSGKWSAVTLPTDGINIVFDTAAPTVKLSLDSDGIYNGDATVTAVVTDPDDYSGLASVEYWILDDVDGSYDENSLPTDATGTFILTTLSTETYIETISNSITVASDIYNSSTIEVYVKAIDNAGNETIECIDVDIDATAPTIEVEYDNNTVLNSSYFSNEREATVTITERTSHFDKDDVVITITAVDVDGNEVAIEADNMISGWDSISGDTPDEDTHTATITYDVDANYTFEISYTDKAGNEAGEVSYADGTVAGDAFTVDTTDPTGTVTVDGNGPWETLLSIITFGLFSNDEVEITATVEDETSPAYIEYYKTSSETPMTSTELDDETFTAFSGLTLDSDEQFVVYLKLIDYAGNYTYINSDGMIIDTVAAEIELTLDAANANGLYNDDVDVQIDVAELLVNNTYSGINSISYSVYNMGDETQSGTLYTFKNDAPSLSDLLKEWNGSITIDSDKNNSNDVEVVIYVEDNAGNTAEESVELKIDVTDPSINISYDNNSPDSGEYYNANRTATVVVSERNFDEEDVLVAITNTDGTIPTISGWTKSNGTGNGDNTTYTATITYSADGDYTFDIQYTDLADNTCPGAVYVTGTMNAEAFTIDQTVPVISVAYSNNDATNNTYFNEARTATITVVEHNFDVSRVEVTQTASLDGSTITAPTISWSSNGDTHTGTIVYSSDGDYTFDMIMTDMAANQDEGLSYGSSIAGDAFTVDTTIEDIVIAGVENGVAYKDDVTPEISFSDINLGEYEILLTRTNLSGKDVDVTDEFVTNIVETTQSISSLIDTFAKTAENDGIYTLYIMVSDMAGNSEEETIVFTVNRYGSVYEYSDNLWALIVDGGAYVQSVDEDFVITEYNADRLVSDSLVIEITLDGKPLDSVELTSQSVMNDTVAVGSSGWYEYEYVISASNFTEDGIYKISISSKDATGNTPENTNYEGYEILFRVDSTPPEITSIVGLENSIINASNVEVSYVLFDSIGLESVTVYVDGVLYEVITEFDDINNYEGTFTLTESSSTQSIQLVVVDKAGNETNTAAESYSSAFAFNSDVTVSTSFFVRWYANKAFFWGSIIGTVAVMGAAITFFILGKKKKEEEVEEK